MHQLVDQQEPERIFALNRYAILDSEPEVGFDRVTRLASAIFDVPVAAIAFPVQDRIWFKSSVGLDIQQCARGAGICAHVIEDSAPLVLPDARESRRFRDHPMVAAAPHVRFYAGAPLIAPGGQRIGSLCIADARPRPGFAAAEAGRLEALAALVVDALELRLERRKARRADNAPSSLLAAMGHDIRTPMNGVLGMADLLLMADDLSDRHRRRVEIIKRSGATLLTLLDQILDLSKLEAETLELEAEPFDMRQLVQDLQALFEPEAKDKNLGFDMVDRLGARGRVVGDPARIRQILSTLLSNAVQVTEEGGVSLLAAAESAVGSAASGRCRIRFEVKDTGPGVEPAAFERVFAPFEQADRRTWSRLAGTGLGLAIGKKLALMMGGDVGIDSTPGRGATFWFELDLAEPAESPPARAAGQAAETIEPTAGRPCREVLVAEDDPDMAFLIDDMLCEAGYRVTLAHDGAAALHALGERWFDVILMDGRMPDMSGFEATGRIRKLPDGRARLPIIALTAEALAGDRERFLAAGMDGYISKPIDCNRLIETIERCCRERAGELRAEAASV